MRPMVKGSCWQRQMTADHVSRLGSSNDWECLTVWGAHSHSAGDNDVGACLDAWMSMASGQGHSPCDLVHVPHQGMQPYVHHEQDYDNPFPCVQDQGCFDIDLGVDVHFSNALAPRAAMSGELSGPTMEEVTQRQGSPGQKDSSSTVEQQEVRFSRPSETKLLEDRREHLPAHKAHEETWIGAPSSTSTERPQPRPASFFLWAREQEIIMLETKWPSWVEASKLDKMKFGLMNKKMNSRS